MNLDLAPIVIFAFNRPNALRKMLGSLAKNPLFNESMVYVYVDGPRNVKEQIKVDEVISIARSVTTSVFVSPKNKGLGPSIIAGVSEIVARYGKAIVLEDDLHLMPGFLTYMNQALVQYEKDKRIFSICGYGLKIKRPQSYEGDVYLNNRSSSWGWATWKNRWETIDWEVKDFSTLLHDKRKQKAFNKGGSDMFGMLKDFMEGRNKSWAIRFCYSQFKQGKYSVHPFDSLVDNEGFGEEATNCKQTYSRFKTCPNQTLNALILPKHLEILPVLLRENYYYHSLTLRTYSFIRNLKNRLFSK